MESPFDDQAVIARCTALGLTVARAKHLAGPEHSWGDVAHLLGVDRFTLAPIRARHWLWMAAQTCSVSYRQPLSAESLFKVLTTGSVAPADVSTIRHFLEEAPLQVVVMSIAQAAENGDLSAARIWANLDRVSEVCSSTRLLSMNDEGALENCTRTTR